MGTEFQIASMRLCAQCQDHKPLSDFNFTGSTRCKGCSKRPNRGVVKELTTCPVCAGTFQTTAELTTHLRAEHVITSGRKQGLVLGIDVVHCLLCLSAGDEGSPKKLSIEGHLQLKHSISAEDYLQRFPHALIAPYRSGDLGGGRKLAGERRREFRKLVEMVGRRCDLCDSVPDDWSLHMRHSHGKDYDLVPNYSGLNAEVVTRILHARSEEDRLWRWEKKSNRTYFLQAGGPDRPIKIGQSFEITKRIRAFQTSSPDDLVVLLTVPSEVASEQELHDKFHALNLKREWFKPDPSLLSHIEGLGHITKSR